MNDVQNAIRAILSSSSNPMSVSDICAAIASKLDYRIPESSIRSSLRIQSRKNDGLFTCISRGVYAMNPRLDSKTYRYGNCELVNADAFSYMSTMPTESVHAVVTDPPYGLVEYKEEQIDKLRKGRGGIWRLPPSFDGARRSPLPRFTTLTKSDRQNLYEYFKCFGELCMSALVPGANVVVASNPLVCHIVASALEDAGLETRGQIVRLVQTMRGGDRPKGGESDYHGVSVMPRSQFEPWVMMRKPLSMTVASNLDSYGTGGWMRLDEDHPFGDVIKSSPTNTSERKIANHPSLKPQKLLRHIVRGVLPLGEGVVLDPFAGSGSTLAACEAVGYKSIGIERDAQYFDLACDAIPRLAQLDLH